MPGFLIDGQFIIIISKRGMFNETPPIFNTLLTLGRNRKGMTWIDLPVIPISLQCIQ